TRQSRARRQNGSPMSLVSWLKNRARRDSLRTQSSSRSRLPKRRRPALGVEALEDRVVPDTNPLGDPLAPPPPADPSPSPPPADPFAGTGPTDTLFSGWDDPFANWSPSDPGTGQDSSTSSDESAWTDPAWTNNTTAPDAPPDTAPAGVSLPPQVGISAPPALS